MTQAIATQQGNKQAADKTAIRPFRFEAPEADLIELRRRITATRFPEKETVADPSQGVQLAFMQALASYWATEYDWRKVRSAAKRAAEIHHGDRRARHPFHPCPLEA